MNEKPVDTDASGARRTFIKQAGAAAIMSLVPDAVRTAAWAAGSDAPEKKEVKIGFIPLTDCASVVMASVHGVRQEVRHQDRADARRRRGPRVRDKLVNGELDAAHVLYGLIYGVQMGIGGPKKDMAVLMNLNHNGQAITLSNKLARQGRGRRRERSKALIDEGEARVHLRADLPDRHARDVALLLARRARHQPDVKDVKTITVPPPQMVANMRVGNMDGFCVGEPWNNRAIVDKIGFTAEHHAGHLEGPSGEDARHHRRVRAEVSEHRARDDRRRASRPAGGSTRRCRTARRWPRSIADKSYVNYRRST